MRRETLGTLVESDQQLFLLKMTKARLTLKALATFNSLQKGSEIIHAYSFHLLCSPTFFYKDFYFRGGEGISILGGGRGNGPIALIAFSFIF